MMWNPILQSAEQEIEASVAPTDWYWYLRLVVRGLEVTQRRGLHGIMASIDRSEDPVRDAARGAAVVISRLRAKMKSLPLDSVEEPAAHCLMLNALDFAARARVIDVGPLELERATSILNQVIQSGIPRHPSWRQ